MAKYTIEMLNDAVEARHRLLTGQATTVVVDQNGERLEFNKVNLDKLDKYIAEIEAELGLNTRNTHYPLGFFF